MAVEYYKDIRSNKKLSFVQWQGDNLKEVIQFLGSSHYVSNSPSTHGAIMIPVGFMKDVNGNIIKDRVYKMPIPIIHTEVELGMWISFNGEEFFTEFESPEKTGKYVPLKY